MGSQAPGGTDFSLPLCQIPDEPAGESQVCLGLEKRELCCHLQLKPEGRLTLV
jgi:hypothetical protein